MPHINERQAKMVRELFAERRAIFEEMLDKGLTDQSDPEFREVAMRRFQKEQALLAACAGMVGYEGKI